MSLISIIIPVYNAEKLIDKCYQSIISQTFTDYEVIFVNDGSSDNSLQMLNEICDKYPNMKVISQENQGQAVARNVGIQNAKGDFVTFVDIDDYIHEDLLRKLYEKQLQTNADIVWCNAFLEKNGEVIGTLDASKLNSDNGIKEYILNNAGPWRKLIKKSIIIENDLYFPSIRFYEDLAVVPAWGLFANSISYVEDPLYYYVLHEGSTMHQTKYNKKLECIFDCMDNVSYQFNKNNDSDKYDQEIEYLYIDHLLHAASLRFFAFHEGKELLKKINNIMKDRYPNWNRNVYYKNKPWKYKLVCQLFYREKYSILNKLLK